jgi:hypothetical protein
MIVARLPNFLETAEWGAKGKAAQASDISKARLSQANTVLRHAPDLADAVVAGAQSLDVAYSVATDRKRKATNDQARAERLRATAPDLAERVSEGTLTLDEAIAVARERRRRPEEERRDEITLVDRIVEMTGDDDPALLHAWAERLGPPDAERIARLDDAGQRLRFLAEKWRCQ